MAEYTPSEDEMRHAYWLTRMLDHHAAVDAAFDRFLARVRRDTAAEHRATRAEAQSAIRGRAVVIYRDRAREAEARIKAWAQQYDYDMCLESDRADAAEARVKAVQELHQQSAMIRRIPRYMRQGHDDDQPFHYCTGCDGARYPCPTILALDATTTQETR